MKRIRTLFGPVRSVQDTRETERGGFGSVPRLFGSAGYFFTSARTREGYLKG